MDRTTDAESLPAQSTVNSLWLGDRLGPLSAACLASFVRQGHRVVLYAYEPLPDVPPGVVVADAATVLPTSRIFRHFGGSYAVFADLFRYELLRRGLGTWIDCDLYCVRPFPPDEDHVYGWENVVSVAIGALRLPADSPVLATLRGLFDVADPLPPWLPEQITRELREAKARSLHWDMSHLPWGTSGPAALTYLLRQNGLLGRAQPPTVFYPISLSQARQLFSAHYDVALMITPQTRAVHLWNQVVANSDGTIEKGSPIDRLYSQGTLFDESRIAGIGRPAARR